MQELYKITKVTRRDILLSLNNLDEILNKFFNFAELPSTDGRFDSMAKDYWQHRENNNDWEDDWFIDDNRLNILEISDERFLELCAYIIHPENKKDKQEISHILKVFNSKLIRDGFEIVKSGDLSGYPTYIGRELPLGKSRKKLEFHVIHYKQSLEGIDNVKYPCLTLTTDNWNDYSYRTYFHLHFYKSKESLPIEIGGIKIAHNEDLETVLPNRFFELDDSYFSLIDSLEDYRKLRTNSETKPYAGNILEALNDLTINKVKLKEVRSFKVFNTSLLRNSELQKVLDEIGTFSFSYKNSYREIESWINFNFQPDKIIPYRTIAIIGENGSGKTTLLKKVTEGLIRFSQNQDIFTERPRFSKIITISYSIFDNNEVPEHTDKDVSYLYCGLGESLDKNLMENLRNRFISSLNLIEDKGQINVWKYIIQDFFTNSINVDNIHSEYSHLSSGQKILVTIFTEILAKIEQGSLLLFDEPETHLHPSIIFKLINTLNKLLDDYDSYLIIATHSPIVIQQIPSKKVMILRDGAVTKLGIESFGENFSTLTKEVFGNYESTDISYKELFRDLVKKYSENEISSAFDSGLNLNARIYLKGLFNKEIGEK